MQFAPEPTGERAASVSTVGGGLVPLVAEAAAAVRGTDPAPKPKRLKPPPFGDERENPRPVCVVDVAAQNAPEPKRALTVNEVVRLYSISRSSLYTLIARGVVPNVVVCGRRLVPRDSMEKLIAGDGP